MIVNRAEDVQSELWLLGDPYAREMLALSPEVRSQVRESHICQANYEPELQSKEIHTYADDQNLVGCPR